MFHEEQGQQTVKSIKPTVDTSNMSREEWLRERQSAVGSSDSAALLNLDPYRTALDVFLDKTTPVENDEMPEPARWGLRLEPWVLEETVRMYVEQNPGAEVKLIPTQGIYRHPKGAPMAATPDAHIVINGELGDLSAKTTNWRMAKYWEDGEVPDIAQIQCHHQMECIPELKFSLIGCFLFVPQFELRMVPRDDSIGGHLRETCERFWKEHVETRLPPLVEDSVSLDSLKRLFPQSDGSEIILSEEVEKTILTYTTAQDNIRHFSKRKDEAQAKLEAILGTAAAGVCGDYTVRWTDVTTKRFDSKKFKAAHPELYEQFLRESHSRRFGIKKPKE